MAATTKQVRELVNEMQRWLQNYKRQNKLRQERAKRLEGLELPIQGFLVWSKSRRRCCVGCRWYTRPADSVGKPPTTRTKHFATSVPCSLLAGFRCSRCSDDKASER
eukprot:4998454-Amphidinium_carterae.1